MNSSGHLAELALTEQEVARILRATSGRALLVGGQALAVWAQYYAVAPPAVLAAGITRDVDFLAGADTAGLLFEALRPDGWSLLKPSPDDATPQTAKLSKRVAGEGIKQIDFLGSIVGLESSKIRRRAVLVRLGPDLPVLVLHPLDVLESRLRNLAQLPSKQNAQGIAQAQLALDVVHAFLCDWLSTEDLRKGLDAIERVFDIALDSRLRPVFQAFTLDPLRCVPVQRVKSENFREQRWPQVQAAFAEQKQRAIRNQNRRKSAKVRSRRDVP